MQTLHPILLVEDDNVDAMTVKRALKDLHINNALVHLLNGEEALHYVADAAKAKPLLILLDLNMPKMNGIEFLRAVKADPQLKPMPVIVLTTSKEKRDVLESFELGAAGYMVKPVDYARFVEIISTVVMYWKSSELPKQETEAADENLEADIVH
jgi:CheY-like chemotaxis protein